MEVYVMLVELVDACNGPGNGVVKKTLNLLLHTRVYHLKVSAVLYKLDQGLYLTSHHFIGIHVLVFDD